MDRKALIKHLKQALVHARKEPINSLDVGKSIAQALDSADLEIKKDIDATMCMHGLAQKLFTGNCEIEAQIMLMAIDLAAAAINNNAEFYHNCLLELHNVVCKHLDTITAEDEEPAEVDSKRNSTLN